MSYHLEVELDDGELMLVEVSADEVGYLPAGAEAVKRLPETFAQGLGRARELARVALRELRAGAEPPDRVTVEFGLKGVVKTGFVLASAAGEAHVKVTVEWHRPGAAGQVRSEDPE